MVTSTVQSETPARTPKTSSRVVSGAAVLLLALMFLLSGGAALRESVTFDEVAHVAAGLSYWQRLDMRMNTEHPPMAKLLSALPLVLLRTHADYSHPSWTQSENFFPAWMGQWIFGEYVLSHWNEPARVLAWARFPMLLLTIALGWVIFAIGRRLGGPWGGLLALVAYATAPVFITFGPLVLTDVAITLFTLLTLWTFAELWREPTRRNTALFAFSLAGALLSKFSAGALFFAFIAIVLSLRWLPLPDQPREKSEFKAWRRIRRRATYKGIFWAAVVTYIVYLVFSWNEPTPFQGHVAAILFRPLMPALVFVRGLLIVVLTGSRPTFLLGHHYPHGTWLYFPVLLVLKSTVGFLGLTILTGALALWRKFSKNEQGSVIPAALTTHWRALWVGLIVFAGLFIVSHLNVSYRHFNIPLVLMTVLLAPLPLILQRLRLRAPLTGIAAITLTVLLAASCVVTAVRQYPYYMPYVNALGLGKPPYTLMSDSNVDWNQALPEVNRFATQHGIQRLKIDDYGMTDTAATVPGSVLWDCQNPGDEDAGHWVVVSANVITDVHNCTWLMEYPHEPLGAGSMYAVQLPSPIPQHGTPGGPPTAAEQRVFLDMGNHQDFRVMFQNLYRHPESISATVDAMAEQFRKVQEQKRKH